MNDKGILSWNRPISVRVMPQTSYLIFSLLKKLTNLVHHCLHVM